MKEGQRGMKGLKMVDEGCYGIWDTGLVIQEAVIFPGPPEAQILQRAAMV